MQVSDHVRAVQVPEENPMRPGSTNVYLVGAGQVLSIDSGEAIDKFRWMLRGYLAAIERAEIGLAAVTHHHYDHSGNLKHLHDSLGAEVAVPANGVSLLKGRLPKEGVRTLEDGATISLDGGLTVGVLATPGHSVDSLCYYLEEDGVLFTGDTLLGTGTTTVGNLADYRRSLQRLVQLPNLRLLCPGHGPLVHDPRERLQSYIDHRDMREDQILTALRQGGPRTSWEIMRELYPGRRSAPPRRRRRQRPRPPHAAPAGGACPTPPRGANAAPIPSAAPVRRPRPANAARSSARPAATSRPPAATALRRQEQPPNDQWVKPPTYEIPDR